MTTHSHDAPSLARFAKPSTPRAIWQLANTLLPFFGLWACMAWTRVEGLSYLWTLLLAVPTAGLYVRIFILQHDCSHGSFFPSSRANRWLGASLGLITLFPFAYWKKTHGVHHATSGNLDKRELGDIVTMTVEEYEASSRWKRFNRPCSWCSDMQNVGQRRSLSRRCRRMWLCPARLQASLKRYNLWRKR